MRQRHASDGGRANTTQDHPSQPQLPPQQTDRPPQLLRRQSAGPKYIHGSPLPMQQELPPHSVGFRKGSVRPLPSRHVPTDLVVRRESTFDFLQGVLVVNGQVQCTGAAAPPVPVPVPARARSSLRRGSLTSLPLPDIASAAVQELCRLAESLAAQPCNPDDPLELLTAFAGAATGRSHAEELYAYDVDYAVWQQHIASAAAEAAQGTGVGEGSASRQAHEFSCDEGSPSRSVGNSNGASFALHCVSIPPSAAASLGRSSSTRIPPSGLRVRPPDRYSSGRLEPDEQEQETGWPTSLPALSAGTHTCLYQETRRDRALETFVETAALRESMGDGTLLPRRTKKPGMRNKKKSAPIVAPTRHVSADTPAGALETPVSLDSATPVSADLEAPVSADPEIPVSADLETISTFPAVEESSSATVDPDVFSRDSSPDQERVFWSHMYSNPVFDRPYSSLDVG